MNDDPMKLISDLIEGNLTEESGKILLAHLQSDEKIRHMLISNLLLDNMLKKKYSSPRELPTDILSLREMADLHLSREAFLNSSSEAEFDFDAVACQDSQINTPIVCLDPIDSRRKTFIFTFQRRAKKLRRKLFPWCYEKRWGIGFTLAFLWVFVSLLYISYFKIGTNAEPFRPVARIVETINTQWPENERDFKRGQYVEPGKIVLKSGKTRILMENETELILEGPAELVINSPMSVYCNEGKISVSVPKQARGFEIVTPFGKFIDRGTEFAVTVDKNEARLDVVKGRVDTSWSSTDFVSKMVAGTSLKINQYGRMEKAAYERDRFTDHERFQSELTQYIEAEETQRNEEARQTDSLPELLARFDFAQWEQSGSIENKALHGKQTIPSATLAEAERCEGLLLGTKALSLMKDTSVITTNLPCKPTSLTLMARVRIDQLNQGGNALFASSSYRTEQGGIIWQILASGQLQLQIRQSNNENEYFVTERLADRDLAGTWSDFAVTIDSVSRRITLYLDGKRVFQGIWKRPVPLALGNVTIGNVSTIAGKYKSSQYLSGAIQEFRVYSRALSKREISQISRK